MIPLTGAEDAEKESRNIKEKPRKQSSFHVKRKIQKTSEKTRHTKTRNSEKE